MRRLIVALLAGSSILATPMTASALVLEQFFPTTPSTTSTATISYNGTYATPLPTPSAEPFVSSPFSISATLPAQFYAPDGIGKGLSFDGVSGTYTNDGATTDFSNAVLDLKGVYVQHLVNGLVVSEIEETYFILTIDSLLAQNDQYVLNMTAANFLYTEEDPLVADPLAAPARPCSYCTPAIVTILPGTFTVLSGGYASYTPQFLQDPQAGVNAGGTGTITSQLPAVAVPEPGSLALLGGGIVMFGLINGAVRRRGARDRRSLRA